MTGFVAAVDRHLPAPPERVFAAWTDPALLPRWAWAGMGTGTTASVDLRPGGAYRICTTMKNGVVMCFRGLYESLEPPTFLRCTLVWEADVGYPPGTEFVEVTLTPTAEGGTHMAFRHSALPDAKSVEGHAEGWGAAFDLLAKLVQ
jgi:glutathione S-transferase